MEDECGTWGTQETCGLQTYGFDLEVDKGDLFCFQIKPKWQLPKVSTHRIVIGR